MRVRLTVCVDCGCMMPYLAAAPYVDPMSGAKMPPAASTPAVLPHGHSPSAAYPVFPSHEAQGGHLEMGACHTPYHTSSPLRYSHGGSGGGVPCGRTGCYVSHNSTPSLFSGVMGTGGAAGVGGTGYLASYASNELQEYISIASPASDFYYYSPQPFYLESPLPCAAAELYGRGGSPHAASFASSAAVPQGAMQQPGLAAFCYGVEPTTPGAAQHTPSLMSSMSFSGPRCSQWYLPRCVYGASMAAVAASGGMHGYAASTPVSACMPATPVAEEAQSCGEGQWHGSQLPLPPRLHAQVNRDAVGSLALPPSVAGVGRAAQASSVTTGVSSEVSPVNSPTFRPARPPQFLPFDGRAYGLPTCKAVSGAAAAAAIAHSPLIAEAEMISSAFAARTRTAEQAAQGHSASRATAVAAAAAPAKPAAAATEKGSGLANTPSAGSGRATAARQLVDAKEVPSRESLAEDEAAESEEGGEGAVYSPRDRALLMDAHTRLARLRLKAHDEQQKARLAASTQNSPTAATAAVQPRSFSEEGELPVSPIPHLNPSEDAATARLDDSDAPEEEDEEAEGATAADVDTRVVLEQVLSVPGVKWRHDPYSRRVLVKRASHSNSEGDEGTGSGEEADACSAEEHPCKTPLSGSAPTSPYGSQPAASPDAAGRKRRTPDETAAAAAASHTATTTTTQPPESASASVRSQDSWSSCGGGSGDEAKTQPSARRMPIKKVCVRHFVSSCGSGDRSAATDGVVGVLASVVTPRNSRERLLQLRTTTTTAVTTTRDAAEEAPAQTAVAAAARNEVVSGHVMASEEPRKIPAAPAPPAAAAATTTSAVSQSQQGSCNTHRSPLVPPPRSKQLLHNAERGVAPPPTPSASLSIATRSSCSSSSVRSRGEDSLCAREADDAVLASSSVLPRTTASCPPAPSSSFPPSSSSSWALRTRNPQLVPVSTNTATAAVLPSAAADAGCGAAVKTSASTLIDTRLLLRLWHRLDSCGCFRDVLEARQRCLGAESNSSTRVVPRSSQSRRFATRGGEEESDRPSRLRLAMVTEEEVTHVYVLQHRYRTSCAVATRRYECGTEVVVDGDMGVDTGVVALVITKAQYYAMSVHERRVAELAAQLDSALAASIHRPVCAEEVETRVTVQAVLEDATLEFLRFLSTQPQVFHSCRIECMEFVSAEFQADGQKLYVYYLASAPVRFLELATYLNHVFHCRIWMKLARNM